MSELNKERCSEVYELIKELNEESTDDKEDPTFEIIRDNLGLTQEDANQYLDLLINTGFILQSDTIYKIKAEFDEDKISSKLYKIKTKSIKQIEEEFERILEYINQMTKDLAIEDVKKIFAHDDINKLIKEAQKILIDWRNELESKKVRNDIIRGNLRLLDEWIPKLEKRFQGWFGQIETYDIEDYWIAGLQVQKISKQIGISSNASLGLPSVIQYDFQGVASRIHIYRNSDLQEATHEISPEFPEKIGHQHMIPTISLALTEIDTEDEYKIQLSKRKLMLYNTIKSTINKQMGSDDPENGVLYLLESFLPPDMKVADLARTERRQRVTIECISGLRSVLDTIDIWKNSRNVVHFRYFHHKNRDLFIRLFFILNYKDNMDEFFEKVKIWEIVPYGLDQILLFKGLEEKTLIIRDKFHTEYFSESEIKNLKSLYDRKRISLGRKRQYENLIEILEVGVVMFRFENKPIRIEFLTTKHTSEEIFLEQADFLTKLTLSQLYNTDSEFYPAILKALDPQLDNLKDIFQIAGNELEKKFRELDIK